MNIEEKKNKILQWQSSSVVHPLTCGVNSSHENLEPVEKDGQLILKCPDCDYEQKYIPQHVLDADIVSLEGSFQNLKKEIKMNSNPYQLEARNKGIELGESIADALNTMSYEKEFIEGFIKGVMGSHSTLQQSTMRAIFALMMAWADRYDRIMEEGQGRTFDGRTEATLKFCHRLRELVKKGEIKDYFPFI